MRQEVFIAENTAIPGIILANFPVFDFYTFLKTDLTETIPIAIIDHTVRFLQYIFIDRKFYVLFSLFFENLNKLLDNF